MARYSELDAHREWIGYLQPVGLVVSPPALVRAGVMPSRDVIDLQQRVRTEIRVPPGTMPGEEGAYIADLSGFLTRVLGWDEDDLWGLPDRPVPEELCPALPDYGEVLRPTLAVADTGNGDGPDESGPSWLLLVQAVPRGLDLDTVPPDGDGHGWQASPQARLERLLRDTNVPVGLLTNRTHLRLVCAPRGETSGHVTFPVHGLTEVSGRPFLAALDMLLGEARVFPGWEGTSLGDLLKESRRYQNEVSNRLAEQVLDALWELLRGFQAADDLSGGGLLGEQTRENHQHLYGGLLTVLMRLVFLLYAEDRGLLPQDEVWTRSYSIPGLFARLRADAGRHPDTMDQRYGAWAGLLSLFRLMFTGGGHGQGLRLPTRHGKLFNPDAYPFLEGRERKSAPRVSDGCVYRVLERLLVLDGERLSYRSLDVEQIGSVYEAMMGFAVERAGGRSIAVRPKDVVVDVDDLLAADGAKRVRRLKDEAACDLPAVGKKALRSAATAEDVVAALARRVSPRTPNLVPVGGLFLQPTEERRRSGSHYTPRELTQPIVETTLRPVLEDLGERPRPEQVLELKVCDPAMGSGAFLVEACRQLAERLVAAWEAHDCVPNLPPDEDPLLHARRLVAQRCLYGVDKNPFAVDLAKLSLWLVTLAKDHSFTFVDHALKCGDSLVGLTRDQISRFQWKKPEGDAPLLDFLNDGVDRAAAERAGLLALGDDDAAEVAKREHHRQAEDALADVRLVGDLVVAGFFEGGKAKERDERRREYERLVQDWRSGEVERAQLEAVVEELRGGEQGVVPLHWEVEFPEVFGGKRAGFDAVVGNPPFAGKNTVLHGNQAGYLDWLQSLHEGAHGNADLVAHFYRRAFALLRRRGTFGLIATNTIGQGDTRASGLRWICTHGGEIYAATRRVKWPGMAAVVVSVVHVTRGTRPGSRMLDGRQVPLITAFLFHAGGHDDPVRLATNAGRSFVGSYVLGMGFTLDDTDGKGVATPIAEMYRLIEQDPRNAERILPYIGGQEVNSSPTQAHHRHVIDFGEMTEAEARRWPDLMAIVEAKVRPERMRQNREIRKRYWWRFGETTPALRRAVAGLDRVLTIARVGQRGAFAFLPGGMVWSEQLIVFPFDTHAAFCALQSRVHEIWARFFGSSMKDDLRYTPSDCFETFPFPLAWESDPTFESTGQEYYDFRAALMVRHDEGLTKTYNRFHDPDERDPDILRLRELHAAMDRAVLDAYGWTDVPTDCEFLLDYEIDEETWGRKRKPWRYRWPDEVHDEVLARLLDLNGKRAEQERRAGLAAGGKRKGAGGKRRAGKKAPAGDNLSLLPDE